MSDPIRLRDSIDAPSAKALGDASAVPFRYDADKGLASLRAAVAQTPMGVTHTLAFKGVVVAVAVAGIAAIVWLVMHRSVEQAAPVSPVPKSLASSIVAPDAPEERTTTVVLPPPASARPPSATASHASAQPATSSSLAEETASLAAIRRASASDPGAALSLVDQANTRFAGGIFREERESVAVAALAKLGRTSEAKARAQAFLSAYPTSAFADRVKKNGALP